MATQPKLDSDNRAVRFIERWKRGLAFAVILALAMVPGAFAGALAYTACELGGRGDLAELAGLVAFLIFAPWTLGDRQTLQTVGNLAKIGDD